MPITIEIEEQSISKRKEIEHKDKTVHNVIGLPIGSETIECNASTKTYAIWDEQFEILWLSLIIFY